MSNYWNNGVHSRLSIDIQRGNRSESLTDTLSRGWQRGGDWGHKSSWQHGAGFRPSTQIAPWASSNKADWASTFISNMLSNLFQGGPSTQTGANRGFDFRSDFSFDPDGAGPQKARTVSVSFSSREDEACGCRADTKKTDETEAGDVAQESTATDDATTAALTDEASGTKPSEDGAVGDEVTAEDVAGEPVASDTVSETDAADDLAATTGTTTPPIKPAGDLPPAECGDDSMTDDTLVEETTAEASPVTEETPAEETPAEETPAEETPAEETPAEETPVTENCPVEETSVAETPAEDVPQHDVSGDGKGWGDPHFVGADGEKYDVQGEAGKFYNLLSDKGMQVNALFSTYAGNMNVMTELGVTAGSDQIKIGTNAALEINGEAIRKDGTYLNGTVERTGGKVTVRTPEYTVAASGSAYLDVTFSGKNVQRDGVMPAGIWGVTLDGDGKPRLSGGMFGTEGGSMQGGGVLERADGTITGKDDVETYKEYEVANLMDLLFPSHNRYAA